MGESPYLQEIRRLDPVRDHQRIVFLDVCYEFPFDTTRALELAFFRTFAVPSIAEVLASTGEFTERALKRYDDTDLLISTFAENGYESDVGRAAIRRMNQIHGRFRIPNDDFLYVLSTLIVEPFRWNARFGWRRAIESERVATYEFWRNVARLMNIQDVPPSYEDVERFNVEFERERFGYTDAGHRVASAMVSMFVGKIPGVPRALGARGIHALLDEPLLDALGLPHPTVVERRVAEGALRLRARSARLLPPRRRPRRRTAMRRRRTYPRGYRIGELGPPPIGRASERLPS
jgi:ER-bound oxygenase mpaB/B'/Rubber oxygenase, catalytic domain